MQQWTAIKNDAFESYEDIRMLAVVKDIETLTLTFASRTGQNGKRIFGTRRTKFMKALVHWVHDFFRV